MQTGRNKQRTTANSSFGIVLTAAEIRRVKTDLPRGIATRKTLETME
jgi:hypothetical protein